MVKWTNENIEDWMKALKMNDYVNVFKERDVQGPELVYLNRNILRVSFHCLPLAKFFSFISYSNTHIVVFLKGELPLSNSNISYNYRLRQSIDEFFVPTRT